MKLFKCQHCGQLLYFENTLCERCGHALGFDASTLNLLTLETQGDGIFTDITQPHNHYRYCGNAQHEACNWLLPVNDNHVFCTACKLNHTIPNLNIPEHAQRWRKVEAAKHRLVYTLLQMGLSVTSKTEDEQSGLAFDFLADFHPEQKVMMGHEEGLITINISEADEAKRIRTREKLGEAYRTLLGHFRHEVGHYYWDRLIRDDAQKCAAFRQWFGDERFDYSEALNLYYQNGAPSNWSDNFVSAYATAHPWEDWAETWAHYMHIMDTVETAHAFGMRIDPAAAANRDKLSVEYATNPLLIDDFKELMDMWLPLTMAVNSLNRSMGQPDLYPFVIAPPVIEKMSFIHRICKTYQQISYRQAAAM